MSSPERGDLDAEPRSPRSDDPTEAQKDAQHPPQGPREARPRKHETRS